MAKRLFRHLALAHLVERLAVDAQRRRGARFQPLQPDLHAAAVAIAVLVGVDAADGLVDLLDELALAIAVAQLERHVGLLAGAVVRVGEHGRLVLHGVDRAIDLLRELGLDALEDLAEVRALLRIHVILALLRGIGRERFSRQFHRVLFASAEKNEGAFVAEKPLSGKQKREYHGALFVGLRGVWRSLVARLLWEQDVGSSNLSTPTMVWPGR